MKEETYLIKELVTKRTDLMETPKTDANSFFQLMENSIQGLRQCRIIYTAIELGVFDALKTPLSAGDLAIKLNCNSVLMPHFCEALCGLGLLDRFEEGKRNEEKERNDRVKDGCENKDTDTPLYLISEISASFLLKASPFSQQHYLAEKLRGLEMWDHLAEILKNGPEILEKGPFFEAVISCMAENARCGLLQETIKTVMENINLGDVNKLLDLGGGHGLYSIAFAKQNEKMQAFVFDLPSVTEKTKQFIKRYDSINVDVIPGDFFKDEIGTGYDMIFSSFNPGGKVPTLLPKIAAALNPGAIFVTRQVQDEKMQSNSLFNLDWNLWVFEDTKKGGAGYSFENSVPFKEYIEMFGDHGLEVFKTLEMKDGSKMVFARKIEQKK